MYVTLPGGELICLNPYPGRPVLFVLEAKDISYNGADLPALELDVGHVAMRGRKERAQRRQGGQFLQVLRSRCCGRISSDLRLAS